jgi:hypothetical protein
MQLMLGALQLASIAYVFGAVDVHIQWSERIEQQLASDVERADFLACEELLYVSCRCLVIGLIPSP